VSNTATVQKEGGLAMLYCPALVLVYEFSKSVFYFFMKLLV